MTLLSDEKIDELWRNINQGKGMFLGFNTFARAIEAAVLEELAKQEPVCFFNGYYGGRVVVEMLNPRVVYPIGTALYAAPVVQPDMRRLCDDITDVVAKQLHYFDNVEKINNMTSAKEVSDTLEGGINRYRNDALFHAKVCSLVAQLSQVIAAAEGKE